MTNAGTPRAHRKTTRQHTRDNKWRKQEKKRLALAGEEAKGIKQIKGISLSAPNDPAKDKEEGMREHVWLAWHSRMKELKIDFARMEL